MEKWQRLVTMLAAVLLMLVLVASTVRLLMAISHTIVLFALGLLLAYGLDPVVEWLRRTPLGKNGRRPTREVSVTVVVIGFLAVVGIGFWALEGRVVHEVRVLRHNIPVYRESALRYAMSLDARLREAHVDFSIADALVGIRFADLSVRAGNALHSDLHPFSPSLTGQTLYVSGGAGFTPGDYTINAVDPNGDAILSGPAGTPGATGGAGSILKAPADIQGIWRGLGESVLPIVGHVFVTLGESIIVLLIAVYFLIYSAEMRERFTLAFPLTVRERIDLWQTDVNRILGGFVRGQLLIAILMGALAAAGCLVLGIRIWLLLGIVVTLCALIPVFGPYLGAIPAIVAALVGGTDLHNPVASVVVLVIYFTVINEIGSKILYPKLVGAALGLHPVVVLFALFAGLEVGHMMGVLLAAPLTALVIVSTVHLYRWWQDLPDSLVGAPIIQIDTDRDARKPTPPRPNPAASEQGS